MKNLIKLCFGICLFGCQDNVQDNDGRIIMDQIREIDSLNGLNKAFLKTIDSLELIVEYIRDSKTKNPSLKENQIEQKSFKDRIIEEDFEESDDLQFGRKSQSIDRFYPAKH